MSTNLQTLLRDSLLNNTYDYSVLHETLKDTWTNSYSYLYQLQKSYIEYEEHNYISNDIDSRKITNIGHLYVNKSLKACFDIDYNLIHVANRDEFKRSRFFNSSFTIKDMVENPQLFGKLPIIIIDGHTIWDYQLRANHELITCILPFNRNFVISNNRNANDDNIYLEHNIQVFIVDNTFYTRLVLNKSHLAINRSTSTISVDLSLIDTKLLEKTRSKEGIYFISVHVPNTIGENYELGTILMPCTEINNKLVCNISLTDLNKIASHTSNLFVSIVFINQLHLHSFYTGNSYTTCIDNECNLFILQRDECVPYAMPIPVENLMIIRKRNDVISYVKNTDAVELYYPNIYRIKDSDRQDGDIYYVYYFYKYAEFLKYTPMYDFYYDFLKIHFNDESLEKIIDEIYHGKKDYSDFDETQKTEFVSTFEKILNREYYKYQYGEIDFIKRYLLDTGNSDKDPIEYKDEIFREWIAEDPTVLRTYVLNQNKLYNAVYHLWTKNLDLNKRLRTSTYPELGEDHGYSLSQEYYVFSFRNDNTTTGKLLDARVFVDGLLAANMIQVRHYFTDYFYIPASLITSDSYIEIEIFPSYEYAEMLHFTSLDDEHEVQLLEPADSIYPTVQDVYYIAPRGHMMDVINESRTDRTPSSGGDTVIDITAKEAASLIVDGVTYEETEIYDPALFQLTSIYNNIEFPIETTDSSKPVVFTRLSRFKIKPISENILNRNIVFCISKNPSGLEIEVKSDIFPYISLVGLSFNYNYDYIRVFRNGRLVPKTKYQLIFTHSFPRIIFIDAVDIGDIIYVDVTPYQYKEVFYQEELEDNQNIFDFTGKFDRPFDIRYYDVYLNGRKLSLNNIISLSPWKIALTNLQSKYHLQIFEKERDYEYFGTEFKNNKYFYVLDDLLKESFVTETDKESLLNKIINTNKDKNLTLNPNVNTEDRLDYTNAPYEYISSYLFYSNHLLPLKFVNPDQLQLNKYEIEMSYPIVYNTYYTNPKDFVRNIEEANRREKYEPVLMLDPDILMHGLDSISSETDTIVYAVGHLGDVDKSIFDTE